MKKINTTYLIALSALVFASCSESNELSCGIPLSKEKIAFAATLQDGWNGGTSTEAGNSSRAGKPTFSGLAMEQKVLTANEGLAKPLYLHPLETENTTVMNAMPQTRGVMNESSTVGSFGVSAVYSKDGANYSSLFQNEEATQNGNYWFTSSNATWPLDGSVSFYAYAPNKDTSLSLQGRDDVMKNKTIRYTANTDDFSKQPDLIVAKNENNAFTSSTANKAVGLSFSHALTAITFSISADMIPGTVKSIKVSGVYGQGDYDLSKGKWIKLANPSTYVIKLDAPVKAGESKALTDKNSALMMIPQPFGADADAKVSMVFNDGSKKDKTVSFSLNGTWDAGKHITYVLSSSKITTLNMGSLTYPSGWNSVNQIRTKYAPNTSAGLFVVNEGKKVIAANVQLTYNGTSWSFPADSKLKFSPKYSYFVYYPYQDQASLTGLPAVNTTISDVSISSSTQFFADAIATWKSRKIATDQSTLEKMNDCDLQIGKASLDDDGCSVSFKMEHAMGLAEITREEKAIPHLYKLSIDEKYTWTNGETSTTASSSLKDGKVLYNITSTKGLFVISPSTPTIFNSSSTGDDAWKDAVTIMSAADNVSSNIAYLNTYLDKGTYTMAVGDIYYNDGAITKPEDISTARSNGKTPIGVIGYIGNNKWTESGTGSGYGGHALVMCLKNIGSTSATDMGSNYQWYSSDTDCGRFKVNTGDLVRSSSDKDYGSGYIETNAIIEKWNSAAEAAYYAKNYQTLPANPTKCTGWFLPTAGQYYAVMSQLGGGINPDTWNISDFSANSRTVTGKINTALSKAGNNNYTQFFQNLTWAWTSSEFSVTTVVRIDSGIDNNKGAGSFRFDNEYGKSYQRPVRPFLAF